ncbi:aryl-alcohol dehydrogenase-like predicted oxidoreductase [Devosia subaequoris]|uniref:Aryl-alcohol dehydrogenase-like predicted oxidoreductase n=1 Tax=Devosia subaequoris TaxID=395930 RepID=A0A7W6IPF4_9HYPH|nr:aldo/keto reductase [Devosia subaequoris]MBB4053341.1 aryl-alcohol dehydrogenase-like predicted oxidoreductase [Devosia subaequoris]MCP1211500.1 aldo/keto reductase [Devosia subaequoris]
MEYSNLGRTGLKLSRLAMGCMTFGSSKWAPWVLDEEQSRPILEKALDLGINFFDLADMYSAGESERVVGRVLADQPRHKLVLATKLYNPMSQDPNDRGLSRKHVFEAVDGSLKRLGTDYIDLYQLHRFDYETPLEETLDALNDVVRAGKVRYLGASSMHGWQFMKALGLQRANGWAPFVSMQPHYNLIYREEEREMLPLCRSEGIGVIPWSPLARGRLAGRGGDAASTRAQTDKTANALYDRSREQDDAVIAAVRGVAERHGRSPAQIAYAWVASRPGITAPIVGISNLHQFDDAVAALEVTLSEEDVAQLEAPYQPKPIAGHQ